MLAEVTSVHIKLPMFESAVIELRARGAVVQNASVAQVDSFIRTLVHVRHPL